MAGNILHNEVALIRLTSKGDEQAFKQIFDFYSNRLFAYVFKITNHEEIAEEIVMDVFLKVWTNRSDLAEIGRFDSYLYAMVRNRAFNIIKRIAHEGAIIKELSLNCTEYQQNTEDTVIYNDVKHLLQDAIEKLPPQQKLVFMLSRDEGLKYQEIAEQLNLSKNTVKSHLKKAVSSLRVVFSNYMVFLLWICLF